HRPIHPLPTRRSSDLTVGPAVDAAADPRAGAAVGPRAGPAVDPCRTCRPTMDVNVAIGGWGWFSGDMMHDAAPSADRSDPAALVAEGRAHLGLELGSTRIKAALIDDGGTVLGTGSHAWENQLVDDSWTYSLDDALTGVQDCYADLVRDV